jgi:hypothetical protein
MPKAIETLVAILDDPKASAPARVAAATAIIDRGYGKPVQAIEASGFARPATSMTDDELAAIVSDGRT